MKINDQDFAYEECRACGVRWLLPQAIIDHARTDPEKWFYCPNGHRWHFAESNEDHLRRENQRLIQRLAERADEIARLEREESAQKAQITKFKRRVAAGVCPCCKRHFTNVERHMKSQHPVFAKKKAA